MDDMSHSWDDFIGEVLTMLPLRLELARDRLQARIGPWEKDGKRKKSKYTTG
jgi:hypothetical protein